MGSTIDFGLQLKNVQSPDRTTTVSNPGSAVLGIHCNIEGADLHQFSTGCVGGVEVPVGTTYDIQIWCTPFVGEQTATLTVETNDSGVPDTSYLLTCTGVLPENVDTDDDGLDNAIDPDDDDDGIPDEEDGTPLNDDTDGDGQLDGADPDIDGDGLANATDPDAFDPDVDGDGIGDALDESSIPNNVCTVGIGEDTLRITPITWRLICAADSILVDPITVGSPGGHLILMTLGNITFTAPFSADKLTVINIDPCPGCFPP